MGRYFNETWGSKKLPLAIKEAETLENNLKDEVDSCF